MKLAKPIKIWGFRLRLLLITRKSCHCCSPWDKHQLFVVYLGAVGSLACSCSFLPRFQTPHYPLTVILAYIYSCLVFSSYGLKYLFYCESFCFQKTASGSCLGPLSFDAWRTSAPGPFLLVDNLHIVRSCPTILLTPYYWEFQDCRRRSHWSCYWLWCDASTVTSVDSGGHRSLCSSETMQVQRLPGRLYSANLTILFAAALFLRMA